MVNNFAEKFIAAMGMKVGDRFHLYDENGENIDWGNKPYVITENGPVDCDGDSLGGYEWPALFAGRFERITDDGVEERLRNIEEELELMTFEIDDLTAEVRDIMEQIRR